jgi:predicted DNA binding CopG/RHH family protein
MKQKTTTIRIPEALLDEVDRKAAALGYSRNQYIVNLLKTANLKLSAKGRR